MTLNLMAPLSFLLDRRVQDVRSGFNIPQLVCLAFPDNFITKKKKRKKILSGFFFKKK